MSRREKNLGHGSRPEPKPGMTVLAKVGSNLTDRKIFLDVLSRNLVGIDVSEESFASVFRVQSTRLCIFTIPHAVTYRKTVMLIYTAQRTLNVSRTIICFFARGIKMLIVIWLTIFSQENVTNFK
jgi:hypothetical protein